MLALEGIEIGNVACDEHDVWVTGSNRPIRLFV